MGCVHIYCGDGKGKTTAAIGLAIRAAGRDKKVVIARFLKTDDSGEVISLEKIPQIMVIPCEKSFGFYWNLLEKEKVEAGVYYSSLLEQAFRFAEKEQADLLILDEIIGYCNHNPASYNRLYELLEGRRGTLEVAMTGRNPSERLISLADYVSEIKLVKHPYEKGVAAREGIEY